VADPSLFYWVLVPAALIGGFLRGFAGFGGPLFMLPILNVFLPPAISAGVMMWIDLFANVQLLPGARHDSSRAVVVPLTIGTLFAMPAGMYLLLTVDPVLMKRVICGAILAAALVLLTGWRYRRTVSSRIYGGVGALSGFVMGATSIAAVTPLFLSAGNHSALENRANFIVWVFLATLLFLGILAVRGTLGGSDAVKIALLTPAYLAGIAIGSRLVRATSDQAVRRAVLALIITVALGGLIL
jgi:uncharacterized membrane protein YfcA